MALSVTSRSQVVKTIRCIRIEYSYVDLEKHENVKRVDYVDDVEDLPSYFSNLNNENFIIDFKSHLHCRLSPTFKITSVDLSEKIYNQLFDVSPLKK